MREDWITGVFQGKNDFGVSVNLVEIWDTFVLILIGCMRCIVYSGFLSINRPLLTGNGFTNSPDKCLTHTMAFSSIRHSTRILFRSTHTVKFVVVDATSTISPSWEEYAEWLSTMENS